MKTSSRFLLTAVVLMATLFPLNAREAVLINFPNVDVVEVLEFYRHLIGRPVLVDLELDGVPVTVIYPHELPQDEALAFIRETLLAAYGIEVRDSDRGEVLATWSQNPKYPHPNPARRKKITTPVDK